MKCIVSISIFNGQFELKTLSCYNICGRDAKIAPIKNGSLLEIGEILFCGFWKKLEANTV